MNLKTLQFGAWHMHTGAPTSTLLSWSAHFAGIASAHGRKLIVPPININCFMVFEKQT